MAIKKIGVLTSGGDAPGMNAAIRGVVRAGFNHKVEIAGIFRGYSGLLNDEIKVLSHRSVSNIMDRGGTVLKTSRCPEFLTHEGQKRAVEILHRNSIDAVVVIGGDGSYRGALALSRDWKIPCVGLPGTIDNDLNGTDRTIGSDTALETALGAIDKIKDTVNSMERIFIVEVMGRNCGYLALRAALAGGAEQVLIPEVKYELSDVCQEITEGYIRGKASWIIILAEGAGNAVDLAEKISDLTDLETRVVVLGHIQRGGIPTAEDRILGGRLGAAAVDLLVKGESGKAIGVMCDKINMVPLDVACQPYKFDYSADLKLIKTLT
ncbi:MAG TPA: 6-phosphofructokinase [Candidatus Omnitrophica bacterium]|nr:6-phosphofructokinase [Candidatus Omnitrophota bacterium]